ncbi:NAD(P)H-dependent oxidoreductase [Ensifer sp. ENS04]|uniref:NADPH-dependent FMN reductase n=1 Tax=Ensifer sp. ENS04 TaxID=2769281 RepID=UPI00178538C1|nr:NADPH-dependent FMN reductase [Ensifer sp. ENS04]MBD9541412.1 NAD(P)H-dependent oxidoreductase [Ensifer sp. ENS04]
MNHQSKPRIGIILGSTRESRFADKPANWISDIASKYSEATFEMVDLREYPLPFFEEQMSLLYAPPSNPIAQRWAAKLATLDGFIVVTPEYNHGPSAVLKNAFDYAYKEFNRKPISFVGYGGVGAARSIEQLRLVAVELQMAPSRFAVHIGMVEFLGIWQQGKKFEDFPHLEESAHAMLQDTLWWVRTLRAARETQG